MLTLPTDHPRPSVQTVRGAVSSLTFSQSCSKLLKDFSRQEGVTLFMLLLAAFQTLLHRYSGEDDISVGSPVAGRNRIETEDLVGLFINTLVMRSDFSGNPSFRELLGRVRKMCLESYAHQDLPFEKLVRELQPERDLSRTPLFQVMFNLENIPETVVETCSLRIQAFEIDIGTAPFDLTLEILEEDHSLNCQFVYCTDLFNAATIERMIGHFQTLLEGIVADPNQQICLLPLLTQAERHQILFEWNKTEADYPKDVCIHQLFEKQVERSPDAIAVVFEGEGLTYSELNRRVNQLAHYLRRHGVGPGVLVALCVERSIEMVVCLLAILKAGGAYVPIDPAYPKERLAYILKDAEAPVSLTEQQMTQVLPEHSAQMICFDTAREWIQRESSANIASGARPENLAYVIYTSGSMGKPKGTLIQHNGLCNLATAFVRSFSLDPSCRILQFASLSFDASVLEIAAALVAGATLVMAPREILASITDLHKLLRDQSITWVILPPSVLALLKSEDLPELRIVISAGESCPWVIAMRWAKSCGFYNAYGPTEATVCASYHKVSDHIGSTLTVPIGRPIANTKIYLLDTQMQLVPIGVPGELHIGGDGLGRGYLHQPELTAEKFIRNPFDNMRHERLYKTGDAARYLPNGHIEYLGRIDNQVKIRGFRVELEEIEAVLRERAEVNDAVVSIQADQTGEKRLVAFLVTKSQPELSNSELRRFLKTKLPDYMIPVRFVILEAFPLTPNGKIDRRALPAPDTQQPGLEQAYVAPRSPVEDLVAKIWSEVLGVERVGKRDNFFDLGGHSLLATRMIARVRHTFEVDLPLRSLFDSPTVEGMALAVVHCMSVKEKTELDDLLGEAWQES